MGCDILRFQQEGWVAVVRLLRAVQEHSELEHLSAELMECCQRFRENGEARVLVLVGESRDAFCMCKMLGDMRQPMTEPSRITRSLAEVERPVLVGISGDALGLGLELALACDIRVGSEGSRFGLPHVTQGVMPWEGGTQRLLRTVGKANALEMILTGRSIDAHEAYRIGLISRLVPTGEAIPTVMRLARDMASKSPISLEYCKEAVIKGMELTVEQGLRLEADLYFLMHTTHDRKEGIEAFQEKRKPEFKGK